MRYTKLTIDFASDKELSAGTSYDKIIPPAALGDKAKFLTPSTLSDYAATHMLLTDMGIPIFAEDGTQFTLRDRMLLLIG